MQMAGQCIAIEQEAEGMYVASVPNCRAATPDTSSLDEHP